MLPDKYRIVSLEGGSAGSFGLHYPEPIIIAICHQRWAIFSSKSTAWGRIVEIRGKLVGSHSFICECVWNRRSAASNGHSIDGIGSHRCWWQCFKPLDTEYFLQIYVELPGARVKRKTFVTEQMRTAIYMQTRIRIRHGTLDCCPGTVLL